MRDRVLPRLERILWRASECLPLQDWVLWRATEYLLLHHRASWRPTEYFRDCREYSVARQSACFCRIKHHDARQSTLWHNRRRIRKCNLLSEQWRTLFRKHNSPFPIVVCTPTFVDVQLSAGNGAPTFVDVHDSIAECPPTFVEGHHSMVACPSTFAEGHDSTEWCPLTFTDTQYFQVNGAPMNVDAPFLI